MDNIAVTECGDEDIHLCMELLGKTFPGYDEENFNWRYKKTGSNKPIIVCAKKNAQVIAFISWIPWEFIYNNRKYSGFQAADGATDIAYRGKGLFGKILNFGEGLARKKEIDFFIGFPSRMSYNTLYKEKYIPISSNYYHLRLLNPLRNRNTSHETDSQVTDDLFLFETDKITPLFDQNYYHWRYLENPKNYKIIQYTENNNKAVFIIRENKWKGINEVLLLDYQLTNYNILFAERSFKYLDSCISRKAVYIRTFFNEYSQRGIFLKRFFSVKTKWKNCILIVKPLSGSINNNILMNCFNWDIMPHCIDEL